MRTFPVACLTIALLFQVGCAMAPSLMARKSPVPDQKAAEKYLATRRLESQGKFEQARENYAEMIVKYPDNPEYLHRLGVVCTQLQRFAEADIYYERAHKYDPKNASILTDKGYAYYLRGDLTQAEQTLKDALHLKPSDKRATSNLALVVGARGDIDESLALLRQVNDEAGAFADLAYIHLRRGENELAELRYHDALSLNPKLKDALDGIAQLEKQHQLEKQRLAKKAVEKDQAEPKTEVANVGAKRDVVQQVAATKSADSDVIKTANFTEEWLDDREPRALKDDDASDRDLPDATSATVMDDAPDDIDETAPVSPMKTARSVSSKIDDWGDEEAVITEPVKKPVSKKPLNVVQAGFQFNDDEDPFATATSRPRSAPETSKSNPRKLNRIPATVVEDDADEVEFADWSVEEDE